MKPYCKANVETIKWMAARGHSAIQIARMLRCDPVSVRHNACALGVMLRPERATAQLRILIEG